jgi:hypothetical protein
VRREAEERARLEAEEEELRQPEIEAQGQNGSRPERPAGDPEGTDEATEDLPVYAWLRRVVQAEPEELDWTREVVRAKESRGGGDRDG